MGKSSAPLLPRTPRTVPRRWRTWLTGFLVGATLGTVVLTTWPWPTTIVSLPGTPNTFTDNPSGQFLHISDIHVDAHYRQGATLDSYCHRHAKHSDDEDSESVGRFGAPVSSCDSPVKLVDITFHWLKRTLAADLDFVLFTGDSARHERDDRLPRSVDEVVMLNRYVASRFLALFHPDITPVIHVVGNNDVEPHNLMEPGPNPMLQGLYEAWQEYIPIDQKDLYLTMGYYRRILQPGKLLVAALNTQWFHSSNDAVGACRKADHPGAQQLVWLQDILEQAQSTGAQVIIAGHVAPEFDDYYNSCYKRYSRLVVKYRDVIQGQLFGHNNKDHFYFLANDADSRRPNVKNTLLPTALDANDNLPGVSIQKGVPSLIKELMKHYKRVWADRKTTQYSVVNISPSIIPTYNPTLRKYRYVTGSTSPQFKRPYGTLLDYDQYWLNLTDANEQFTELGSPLYEPDFEFLYSARQQYNMPDLTTESYLDLAYRITQNKTLRREYAEFLCVMTNLHGGAYNDA
ncbi:Endopolyphosphatase [Dispira parvispora]|uniref:Endopolyphosphatase n=1 Tax=Dispira parvispora TaxID=1520584 RepID=A0A9W8AZ90_9FUNG|nr:Endopolyphosphatase [Dispira parvispora]